MKTQCSHSEFCARQLIPAKSGVTLIEVLVSMMILSIGVALLSTLLPISILRTAQASQLTQAVFLRNNAEAYIESRPSILDNTAIAVNTFAVIDPLGYWITGSGNFAGTIPRTSCATTNLRGAESVGALPDSWKIAVDERAVVATNTSTIPYSVTLASPTIASLFVRNSTTPVATPYANHRLVMSDATGKSVVIRPLLQVLPGTPAGTGNEMSWWDPSNTVTNPGASLPPGFVPARARIESADRRFSWLMTVTKREVSSGLQNFNWAAEIECAVFFNRSFSTNDERSYPVVQSLSTFNAVPNQLLGFDGQPGVAGVDDDRNGTTDDASEIGWLGSDDNRTVTVTIATGTPPPFLKKGGFMLEPLQLKWYRIVNFPTIGAAPTTVQLLLDRDIKSRPSQPIANGIFMKGIVDVFSFGVRTGQQ